MYVKYIDWIDKDAEEAAVLVTDGTHNCWAFCHPCRILVGHSFSSPLYSLDEKSVVLVDPNTPLEIVRQRSNSWSHRVVAVIEDKDKKIVTIGRLKLVLTQLPGDLKNGDIIECYPDRLDLVG